ncbi:hypothetical protein SUGI_0793280 [Cryptomeria japonica]|uniref:uncharacterized protein LOC131056547 n=1 Tax=Cryptomeria japonica TaxID=3369 RepID=UPI002414B373|nr:uncharacterized protein LOC131056547 [Cryptomeria japonica]XP_057846842.2 uncharacterized protein LOC131056547 [Cryptomeria japonica]XP_059065592.1 uncharacterized protein LOC131056547 [Cryptomeria japonica]GLJ38914.1 hypothetical protein SUGI_0793280 [Cryptomeria japonica]
MMGSPVTPQDVLSSLMNDGTFDAFRAKIINQLKTNEELKKETISMVEKSKVLNTTGAENKSKRDLFDGLRKELETKVLNKASKSVWELILAEDGLGKEINDTVQSVYYRLSGQELPSSSSGIVHVPTHEESGSSKKRTFSAMNSNGASEPASHVHMNTSSTGRQTVGQSISHGNEQSHMGTSAAATTHMATPVSGSALATNSQTAPWSANHAHINATSNGRQAIGPPVVHGNEQAHLGASATVANHMVNPISGCAIAINPQSAPWNVSHLKS